MTNALSDVLADLAEEYARLSRILSALSSDQWASPSAAEGWTVGDVVLHLALSEEGVSTTLRSESADWTTRDRPLDEEMDDAVRASTASAADVFNRWRHATRSSLAALAEADPARSYRWAAAPLRPRTLATTRLAEHWAHGLDITGPLDLEFPDTDRLRHIAWLGHATIPYGMRLHGLEPVAVRVELTSLSGRVLTFGASDAGALITGSLGAFCRVGAQRLTPEKSGLVATGVGAHEALRALRNYAA
jgi:uncharacterized protein (TIGR03084 family)